MERVEMAEKHLKMAIDWKGEKLGVLETRRHYSSYFKGIPDFKKHKTIMVTSDYSDDIFSLFSDLKSKFKEHELAC
jgi:tRNA-dihydrouridine synthase